MQPPERQLFLSAVTREFQRSREMLRSDLMGPDLPCKVAEQADFAVSGTTLLEKLDCYIAESSAVIHLIGRATGAAPKPLEVARYLREHPEFLRSHPHLRAELGDCLNVSYTQWEAYLALHHQVRLFIYVSSAEFEERPPGFATEPAEENGQEEHARRLFREGLDRSEFATSERLCSMVLRSFSRLLKGSSNASDHETAEDLEVFAKLHDEVVTSDADERATLSPLQFDLVVPAHFVVGRTIATSFRVTEPGRTSLEEIEVLFSVGTRTINAKRDHLAQGQTATLTPNVDLTFDQPGTSQMNLSVSCERAGLRETFAWRGVANILPGDARATSRIPERVERLRLELVEEKLSPRLGLLDLPLQPVPAGGCRFEMGAPRTERGAQPDETLHSVRFSRSWWMSRHPISQQQFLTITGRNPSRFSDQGETLPVESVTWQEATEFCELLTQLELQQDRLPLGFHYRLPTEAEWEFSCRAGEAMPVMPSTGTSSQEHRATSYAISTFPLDGNRGANRFGLCDMTGNVFQWCLDHYRAYPISVEIDPCLDGGGTERVIRGGSWHDPMAYRRPAARMKSEPGTRSSRIGFRVVLARI